MKILVFIFSMALTLGLSAQKKQVGGNSGPPSFSEKFAVDTLTNSDTLTFTPNAFIVELAQVTYAVVSDSLSGTDAVTYHVEEALGSGTPTTVEADWVQTATGSILAGPTSTTTIITAQQNFGWQSRIIFRSVGTQSVSIRPQVSIRKL